MTARDRWTVDLKCPTCGRTGEAELSQEDGWSFSNGDQTTSIDRAPEGFSHKKRSVGRGNVVEFYCAGCGIKAEPHR